MRSKYRVSNKFFPLLVVSFVVGLTLFALSSHKAAAAACTVPSTDYGTVTQTVSIPSTGTYRVWSRIMADSANAANDSFLLEIDGNTCFDVGGTGVSTSAWTWVDYQGGSTSNKVNATNLTAGSHTIKMIGNAANVSLDRIIFTTDTACVPANSLDSSFSPPIAGANCSDPPDTTAPTVSITSPANGAAVGTSISVNTTAADAETGIDRVELLVDGVVVATDTSSPYNFTGVALTQGSHTLVARAYNGESPSLSASSSTITVTVADTTAPSISAIGSSAITQTTATVTWTTNEASDTQVEYGTTTSYGSSTTLNSSMVTSHSAGLSGLTASTTYHYRVKSKDSSGNLATSADNVFTTLAPTVDTTLPNVSMTAPAGGATVSGSAVTVSATATDNTGVVGVQFKLDGANLGAEDTTVAAGNAYSITWNTTGVSNGTHTLSAVARDAAGNTRTATNITVTVNNATSRAEDISQDGKVDFIDLGMLLSKYGQTGAGLGRNDVSGDGKVDFIDLGMLLSKYGT